MMEHQIRETAHRLKDQEIEELLRRAYYSFDAKMREYAESLKEIHS